MMRKGFLLVEVLVLLVLIVAVLAVLSGPTRAFFRDVPRTSRLAHSHGAVLAMLQCLERDVDAAEGFLDAFGSLTGDEKSLLLELPNGVVVYRVEADGVTRQVFNASSEVDASDEGMEGRSWSIPHAAIHWGLLRDEGRAWAVEVHTGLYKSRRHEEPIHLRNVHVFFVNALPAKVQP